MSTSPSAGDTSRDVEGLRSLVDRAAALIGCDSVILGFQASEGSPLAAPVARWLIIADAGLDPVGVVQVRELLEALDGGVGSDGIVGEAVAETATDGSVGPFLEALGGSLASATGATSYVIVPLAGRLGGRGFVFAGEERSADLGPEARRLLGMLGGAAEAVIDAAGVAAGHVEARENEIGALHEIMKEISALGSLDRVLALICRKSAELLGVEISYVALADRAQRELRMRMTHGISPYWRDRMKMDFGVGVGGMVAQERRPVLIEDYVGFEHETRPDIREMVISEGVKAIVAVPMLIADRVTGVLYAADRRPAHFTERDARLLQGMADQAAIAIANSQLYEQERREVEVHDRLSAIVLRDGDYGAIAEALHGLVENPTALYDSYGNLLACHPPESADSLPGAPSAVVAPTIVSLPADMDHDPQQAVAPVWSGEELLGHVLVVQSGRSLDIYDLRVIERAAVVVALRMMRLRVEAEVEQRLRGDILDDLLSEDADTVQSAARRSRHLGHDLGSAHSVLLVELADASSVSTAHGTAVDDGSRARHDVFSSVRRALASVQVEALTSTKGDRVVALVRGPAGEGEASDFRQGLEHALRGRLRAYLPGVSVRAGLGAAVQRPGDLRRSHDEALACLRAAQGAAPGLVFIAYDELGVLGVLYDPADPGRLSRFVQTRLGSLVEYDAAHRSDLVHTLSAYLDSACNKIETSRTLNIHLSTLKYRLDRVGSIIDLDLADPDLRFEAHLATRALAAERRLRRGGVERSTE